MLLPVVLCMLCVAACLHLPVLHRLALHLLALHLPVLHLPVLSCTRLSCTCLSCLALACLTPACCVLRPPILHLPVLQLPVLSSTCLLYPVPACLTPACLAPARLAPACLAPACQAGMAVVICVPCTDWLNMQGLLQRLPAMRSRALQLCAAQTALLHGEALAAKLSWKELQAAFRQALNSVCWSPAFSKLFDLSCLHVARLHCGHQEVVLAQHPLATSISCCTHCGNMSAMHSCC